MAEPMNHEDSNEDEVSEEVRTPDGPVGDFHRQNRERKRALIRGIAQGFAMGVGKEAAQKLFEWWLNGN